MTSPAAVGARRPALGRVLIVHPSAELYGSDRVALESATALRERGWQVTVALAGAGPLVERLQAAGCEVLLVTAPVLRKSAMTPVGVLRLLLALLRSLPGMLAALRRTDPDVVYVSTVTQPWWLVLARLRGRRVLVHVHEAEQDVPGPVRWALALPLLFAHRVIANSRASERLLTGAFPVLRKRSQVIYNGVPGPSVAEPARERLTGELRLVLVGRISPRKGTDVAVRALARLRERGIEARLELVGGVFPGYEWFAAEVRAAAEQEGVADRVVWRGPLSDIWAALAQADIALVPSRVEPFGNAAVEAMLAGRPVIAGDTQGLLEIVAPGRNGELATPGDPVALAATIERTVRDWPGALRRADAARVHAERRFEPAAYRAALAAVIADQRPPCSPAGPAGRQSELVVGCVVGVFDLFHIGHLDRLLHASAGVDHLVVAVPSDRLIEERTGERPFVPETERTEIVGAVRGVGAVVRLDSLDPHDLAALVDGHGIGEVTIDVQPASLAGDLAARLARARPGVRVRPATRVRTTGSVAVRAALGRRSRSNVA